MDPEFDINDYVFDQRQHRLGIDGTFWAELSSLEHAGFYLPTSKPKARWNEKLATQFNVKEYIYYNPQTVGLPYTLTAEKIAEIEERRGRYQVQFEGDTAPVQPRKPLTAQEALQSVQISLMAKRSARNLIRMHDKSKTVPEFTEWEKRVLSWRPGYGFLTHYKDMKGSLFPVPAGDESLKHEVVREYFFHLKPKEFLHSYFSGVILSVAQQPNTDKAIYGFRRDLSTDWILGDERFFDGETAILNGVYVQGEVHGGTSIPVKPFVERMNYLIKNLEELLAC